MVELSVYLADGAAVPDEAHGTEATLAPHLWRRWGERRLDAGRPLDASTRRSLRRIHNKSQQCLACQGIDTEQVDYSVQRSRRLNSPRQPAVSHTTYQMVQAIWRNLLLPHPPSGYYFDRPAAVSTALLHLSTSRHLVSLLLLCSASGYVLRVHLSLAFSLLSGISGEDTENIIDRLQSMLASPLVRDAWDPAAWKCSVQPAVIGR